MEIDPFFVSAHNDLVYELETNGFTPESETVWVGTINRAPQRWPISIDFSPPYPVLPPRIFRADDAPLTWHQNLDNSLCLYSGTQPGAFPWLAHSLLLTKIAAWFSHMEAGWSEEQPDLDLERYWARDGRCTMVIHNDLATANSAWVKFRREKLSATLVQHGFGAPPHRRAKTHKSKYGFVLDVGELESPPRNWRNLSPRIENVDTVEQLIRDRRADLLLVQYSRLGHCGVLGLVPAAPSAKNLDFRAVNCALQDQQTLQLRAGPQVSALSDKRVAIIGVGAIGSFIAAGMHRSGARLIQLVDGDRLRPGNLVRHAAAPTFIGLHKSQAMARTLGLDLRIAVNGSLTSLDEARAIVEASDLVIDATGNEVVTQLLAHAAEEQGKRVISAYLANQGRSKIVEVLPSERAQRLAPSRMAGLAPDLVESGCGDPVSPTPPFAVQEIAAIACRIAVEYLVGDRSRVVSELRETP